MLVRTAVVLVLVACIPTLAVAQHDAAATAPSTVAPREAAQFDFLVGHWELTITPAAVGLAARIHGAPKMLGTWKAWRALDGWGIEDELRITDASGNPRAFSHAVRTFRAATRKWVTSSLDVYRSTFSSSVAEFRNGEMTVNGSRSIDRDGKPVMTRSRYFDITATSFRFTQQRSSDNGQTWTDNLKIEARRVAASAPR